MTEQRIIRIEEVPKEHRKFLGDDKIFMFECEIVDDTLRLGLKEINCFSPYYYEAFFTLDSLYQKNSVFKACKNLEEVKTHILTLFNGNGVKGYQEIMLDREKLKTNLSPEDQKKIDALYEEIIRLDPILMISDLLEKGDTQAVKDFIELHPTVLEEYPKEMEQLSEKYGHFYGLTQ